MIKKTKNQGFFKLFGSLFKNAWQFYWDNFSRLVQLALMMLPAVLLIGSGFFSLLGINQLINSGVMGYVKPWLVISGGVIGGIYAFAAIYYGIVLALTVQTAVMLLVFKQDTKTGFKDALRAGYHKYQNYFLVSLLVFLITIGGLLLFIIPGLIWSVQLTFAVWCYIDRGLKGKAALRESRSLVKGHWWKTFGLLILPSLLMSLAISIVVSLLGGHPDQKGDEINNIVSGAVYFVTFPLFLAYNSAIYKWLKKS